MTPIANFAEALADYFTCCAYDVLDRKWELNFDIPQIELDRAWIVAEVGQQVEAAPEELISETQQWLVSLGNDNFEQHLYASVHQINTGAFHPASATDYLTNFNNALTEKFGARKPDTGSDKATAIVLKFCKRGEWQEVSRQPA